MEDERTTITNKNGKKKIIIHPLSSLSIGNEVGIAGLLVFGGALAIAGFMAVASFASNKDKAKGEGTYDHKPKAKTKPQQLLLENDGFKSEDDHETTHSLGSLIQHSTTQDEDAACCWTSNMSMNQASSSDLLSAQTMILNLPQEEKIDLKPNGEESSPTTCFHPHEIAFSDHSHPQSAASSNENGVLEECLVSFFNSPSSQPQEFDNDEPQDGLKSTTTETEEEDVNDDDDVDEDDDVDDDEVDEDADIDVEYDDVLESDEEDSSKATGSTSLDYNEEPVWPAELIQELPQQEFRGDYCDADDEAMIVTKDEASLSGKANFSVVLNDQPSLLRTWVIPLLLLGLLLILIPLTYHPQESCVLDDVIL